MTDKYGNDNIYESWSDNNIFGPISKMLLDPLYNMKLTPNMITIISTIFTLLSIYYLHKSSHKHNIWFYAAITSYLFGYTLDCVDGKMARKYNMGSDIGIALDMVSDNISNMLLLIYIVTTYKMNKNNIIVLIIAIVLTYYLTLAYGLNEAISSYKATGSDNFYERRVIQLEKYLNNKDTPLYQVLLYKSFLYITKSAYSIYKYNFTQYDENIINKKLSTIKEFGPGNFALYMSVILLSLN